MTSSDQSSASQQLAEYISLLQQVEKKWSYLHIELKGADKKISDVLDQIGVLDMERDFIVNGLSLSKVMSTLLRAEESCNSIASRLESIVDSERSASIEVLAELDERRDVIYNDIDFTEKEIILILEKIKSLFNLAHKK
jgi:hypothetical protein